MEIITEIDKIKTISKKIKNSGEKISLIPTMGKLHDGHISLAKEGLKYGKTIVSIFINPLQFGPDEDYNKYPRDLETDIKSLEKLNIDYVFCPKENITTGTTTFINNPDLENKLCGLFRTGHFQGVLTIVMKLFLIINPDFAVFGLKDYQQYIMIKKMVKDCFLDIKIIPVQTVRELCGLALSSRNTYLNDKDKKHACNFYKILKNTVILFKNGELYAEKLTFYAIKELIKNGFSIDYVKIMDKELGHEKIIVKNKDMLLAAIKFAGVRLIDNIAFE
jgi:pantoate--beta-alanine ligase